MKTRWLVLLLLGFCGTAHADRDIVYAARYYIPPGSHHTSHFHIYRINPDGTGKMQLTFGDADDIEPHWSADGRKVVFAEHPPQPLRNSVLYEINANGGGRHPVRLPKNSDWPPESASGYKWEDADPGSSQLPSKAVLVDPKTKRRLVVRLPVYMGTDPQSGNLLPMPQASRTIVYVQDEGTSSTRPDNLYHLLDALKASVKPLAEGQFLAWSPNALRFCTAGARHLVDYGMPISGYQKAVYAAELQVGRRGGNLSVITHGLCWVEEADRRKEK